MPSTTKNLGHHEFSSAEIGPLLSSMTNNLIKSAMLFNEQFPTINHAQFQKSAS
jgi:hypothetical protein